jgi:hypothetical protein
MSVSKFHDKGVHFDNNYSSEVLADTLDFAMQRQNAFTLPENLGRQGLLQILAPTHEESAEAGSISESSLGARRVSTRTCGRQIPCDLKIGFLETIDPHAHGKQANSVFLRGSLIGRHQAPISMGLSPR